jgi:tungstate transport system substrate-binding protein
MIERRTLSTWLAAAALSMAALGSALAQERFIVMASTTSTEQSGLFAHLLPAFKAATGINVRVVALGTGQALDSARRGDADLVFVHDQVAEEKFVAEGFGVKRLPVMYNDFVIVGPKNDPAGAKGKDVTAALKKLADGKFSFISRGDKSGTHAAELRYWKMAGFRHGRRQTRWLQGMWLRHGPGAEHRFVHQRLCADRPRHLAELQEPW